MSFPIEKIETNSTELATQVLIIIFLSMTIKENISNMRTFNKPRSFLAMDGSHKHRVNNSEKGTNQLYKIVFEKLDQIENQITPKLPANRKKIGFKINSKD